MKGYISAEEFEKYEKIVKISAMINVIRKRSYFEM